MLTQTEISQNNGIAVAKFNGRLTLGSSLSLAQANIAQIIDQGALKIVFDLANVDFVDSAGLGFIIYTHGILKEKGGQLRVAKANPRVLDLFRLTHTDSLLQIDSDAQQSEEKLKA